MKYVKYIINLISTLNKKLIYRNRLDSLTNSISWNSNIYDSIIGKYNYFGPGIVINNTIIKNYCSFAPNVVIGGMEHDYSNFSSSTKLFFPNKPKTTIIEDDVWIGANAVVRTGVVIGRGSIIGSNAVVLKNVPAMSIVVGNPGRIIKNRFSDKVKAKKYMSINFSNNPDFIHLDLKKI
jgi:acetyltransferase-like isoleucine patch superfamily enzyme